MILDRESCPLRAQSVPKGHRGRSEVLPRSAGIDRYDVGNGDSPNKRASEPRCPRTVPLPDGAVAYDFSGHCANGSYLEHRQVGGQCCPESDPQAASIETLSNTSDIAMTANDAKFLRVTSPRTVELWAKAGGRYYYNIVSYGSDFAIGVGNRHRRSGHGSTPPQDRRGNLVSSPGPPRPAKDRAGRRLPHRREGHRATRR